MVTVLHSAQELGDGRELGDAPAVGVELISELLVDLAREIWQQAARAAQDRDVVPVRRPTPVLPVEHPQGRCGQVAPVQVAVGAGPVELVQVGGEAEGGEQVVVQYVVADDDSFVSRTAVTAFSPSRSASHHVGVRSIMSRRIMSLAICRSGT